jgi:hypothetical protein
VSAALRKTARAIRRGVAVEKQVRAAGRLKEVLEIEHGLHSGGSAEEAFGAVVDVAKKHGWFVLVLLEAIEAARRARTAAAVAVPARTTDGHAGAVLAENEEQELDAVITATEPVVREPSQKEKATVVAAAKNWDDILKDYDLNAMLLITRLVVPEGTVDDVIMQYPKKTKVHRQRMRLLTLRPSGTRAATSL